MRAGFLLWVFVNRLHIIHCLLSLSRRISSSTVGTRAEELVKVQSAISETIHAHIYVYTLRYIPETHK